MMEHLRVLVLAVVFAAASAGRASAQEVETTFKGAVPIVTDAGAAAVEEPAGGQYVYSSEHPKPRPHVRFAIGSAPRSDYTVYSAEEQHALEALAERNTIEQRAAAPRVSRAVHQLAAVRLAHHPVACVKDESAPHPAGLSAPKVLREGNKVCVPRMEFADQADWRDHVWCFDKGDGSVR